MIPCTRRIYFINTEECNKPRSMDKTIGIILYKLLMDNQRDKVSFDEENKIINVILDDEYICRVKYEVIKDENIIEEYRKDNINLKFAELIKR